MKSLATALATLLAATVVQAQSLSYSNAIISLHPTGYWPLHEVGVAAGGDIETNYGSLGTLGTGYYNDWNVNGGNPGDTVVIHGAAGVLTNDADTAVDFNTGNTSYMLIPHTSPATTLIPPFTMECWFNGASVHTGQAYGDILGQGGASLNGGGNDGPVDGVRIFWAGQTPAIQVYVATSAGNPSFTSVNHYALDTWHYAVLTCDANTNFTLYVDGALDSTHTFPGYVPAVANPLMVGAGFWRSNGPQRQFHGKVDEVAIYTNALTLDDVVAHYAAGTNGVAGDYFTAVMNNHPLLYYRMDSPAYSAPPESSWPVLTNYGSVALNGVYLPGTQPGGVAGPTDGMGNFIESLGSTNAMPGNGLSALADAGYDPAFNPTGNTPLSVTVWFKGNPADARFQTLVGHSDSSWRLALDGNGKLRFNPGAGSDLVSANVYNDGDWHQVVGVYDGSENYLYVDGVLDASAAAGGGIAGSTDDVLLGADPQYTNSTVNAGAGRQFAGNLCEVAFWNNTALTAEQVQALYGAVSGIAPRIVQQPHSSVASAGGHYTNAVVATGSLPLFYQWYETDSGLVDDQTNASLDFNPLATGNAGNYYVVVTNDYGAVTSAVATLTVIEAPVITQDIIRDAKTNNILLYAGAHPSFSVAAVGAMPLSYQWFTNNVAVAGATDTSYTLPPAQVGGLTNFAVVVTNTEGAATSTVMSVTVMGTPAAPYPQAVLADEPFGYWPLNEGPAMGNDGDIANDYWNADNGIYTNADLSGPSYSDNTDPSATSAWFGTINYSNCMAFDIPNVNFATADGSSNFTVEAWVEAYPQTADAGIVSKGSGNGGEQFCLDMHNNLFRFFVRDASGTVHAANSSIAPDYEWHHLVGVCDETDGSVALYVDGALAGSAGITPGSGILATTNMMIIGARPSGTDTGYNDDQFIGAVSGVAIYGYALSAGQVLSHYYSAGIAPQITQDVPGSINVNENGSFSVTVSATGTPSLSYQWYSQNTGQLTDQTNATLSLSNVASGDTYYVTMSNPYGTAQSGYVSVNIISGAPQLGDPALPPNIYVSSNSVYPYSVQAAGTEPFSYQWYNGGTLMAGETQNTYSLLATTNTIVTVVITNVYGAVTSNPSMVMVIPPLTGGYEQAIQALGPVGYWPMQETNTPAPSNIETNLGSLGAVANAYYLDSADNPVVSHGMTGALSSDSDAAINFNGQNNCYMAAPAISTNLALTVPFSVELWAWPANTSFGMPVAKNGFVGLNAGLPGSGAGNLCGWSVDWARNGSTTWDLQLYHNAAGQGNAIQVTGPASAGTTTGWQHVVFTYDGTTVRFYWNGQLVKTGTASYVPDTWSPLCVGGGRLAQGTTGNQGTRLYNGLEDEVALYTNELSAADVLAHYEAGTNSSPATPYEQLVLADHPLVYYRMDAPAYAAPSASASPALVNYGSVPVTGSYPPNTVPGGAPGPDWGGNTVASPINGLNAAVDAGYTPEFNPTTGQSLTAMVWVKGYPTDGRIQSPMSHGDDSWHFSWDSAGKVHWASGDNGGEIISTQVVNDGNWHLLTGVYDGTQNQLYIDGVLAGASAAVGTITGSGADVYLGGSPDYIGTTNEQYFAGSICQAAFFTNALTAAQIQTLYDTASSAGAPPTVSIAPVNGQIVITYTGTLLSATNVAGPYTPVSGAASPYTNTPTAAQMFYRVSNP